MYPELFCIFLKKKISTKLPSNLFIIVFNYVKTNYTILTPSKKYIENLMEVNYSIKLINELSIFLKV